MSGCNSACLSRYFFYLSIAVSAPFAAVDPGRAQAIETVNGLGLWGVSIEPFKTTYVGA